MGNISPYATKILSAMMEPMLDAEPEFEMDSEVCLDSSEPAPGGGRLGSMLQIALRLKELTVNGLKTFARGLKLGTPIPHPAFAETKFTDAQIETGVKAVEDQETVVAKAEGTLTTERGILQQKITALEDLATAVATDRLNAVTTLPEAEARTALQKANVPLRAERSASPPAERPASFYVNRGDHSGTVHGGCHRVSGALMYRVRAAQNPNGPFEQKYEGSKCSFNLVNQPTGDTWYQMSAYATHGGWSEWSDFATCHVL